MNEFLAILKERRPDWDLSVPDYDPMVLARMNAESYNNSQGTLTGYDCPECRNRGNFRRYREDGSFYFQDCRCMNTRKCIAQMERSGLNRDVFKKCTFKNFRTPQPWQETAKAKAMAYAADPQGWFLACGQSGAGKSHLCTAISSKLLMAGEEVRYLPWRSEITRLKYGEDRQDRMARWKSYATLYIDDLFKAGTSTGSWARPSNADICVAYELLDSRNRNSLRTILSTELTPEELTAVDEAVAGRILEKAGENVLVIHPDSRKNHRMNPIP